MRHIWDWMDSYDGDAAASDDWEAVPVGQRKAWWEDMVAELSSRW
jgi:hypothetical protein